MLEFAPQVDRYFKSVLRVAPEIQEPYNVIDVETARDAEFAPYVEAHARLQRYAIGDAFYNVVADSENESAVLELGLASRRKNIGDSITMRWDHAEIAPRVIVSRGVRVDLRDSQMRLQYLIPSNNPTLEERATMTAREVYNRKYIPGQWKHIFEADIVKLTQHGDFPPADIAHWITLAKQYSGKYFDLTDEQYATTSDPDVRAKAFTYASDESDSQVYIQFKN